MRRDTSNFPFSISSASGEGRLIPVHTKDSTMEIVEVLSGKVLAQVGTDIFEVEEGDFLYVPPTLVFSADALTETASLRAMKFDYSILEANMENFDTEVFYMFDIQSRNRINIFSKDHPVYGILKKYMQESYDEYSDKEVCYKLPIRANIYLMVTALLRHYCGSKDESDKLVYHNVLRLRPVFEYIYKHFTEKIYIDALADMLGVSADYFTKMFKETLGTTPVEYINGLKVNKAMRYLSTTERSMAEIAIDSGFSTPNYFNKIFKQYMNMSPLAYKKNTK